MSDLFRVAFMEMRCLEETSESSAADEPYAVFFAADLHGTFPKVAVFRTQVFEDTDEGELKKQWVRIWGVNQKAQPITNSDKVILLAALMENDESDPELVVTTARGLVSANLLALVSSGISRSELVSKLIKAFNAALDAGVATGFPNADERLGSAQELRLTPADWAAAKQATIRKNLIFSGDGGKYRLGFDIAAGA
jgi:hypothetical protein